jgi:hypothetical protein
MITFKVPSELYGQTDCVITDINFTLKTGFAPCGSGEDYKLTQSELMQLGEILRGERTEFKHLNEAPKMGYILPREGLQTDRNAYRATAHAYLKSTGREWVENQNGFRYTLEEIENSMINPVKA